MVITQEIKETWINYLQCKVGGNIPNISKALSINSCVDKVLRENAIAGLLIDVLYRYDTSLEENCITAEDFCNIITMAKKYSGKCNCK